MSSKRKACIVPGCDDKTSVRHRFPRRSEDHNLFEAWLKVINNPKLFSLSREKIYATYIICDRHFDEDCRVPGWVKLKRGSIPSLFLPNSPDLSNNKNASLLANSQIDLPTTGTDSVDLQLIESEDILLNLDSFELQMVDEQDTLLSTLYGSANKHVQESEQSADQNIIKKIDNITETNTTQLKFTSNSDEIELRNEDIVTEICDSSGSDIIRIEVESPVPEKPYFKSVKSYLVGSRCITEVCRICFRSILNQEMIKLYEDENEDVDKIKNMLKLVLPDLDLEMYPNSVVCVKCTELLVYSYELKETWLTTEEKLQKIVDKKKGVTQRDADLIIVAKPVPENDKENTNITVESNVTVPSQVDKSTNLTRKVMEDILECNNMSDMDVSVFHGDLKSESHLKQNRNTNSKARYKNKIWGLGPYVCEVCGHVITKLKAFKFHLKRHNDLINQKPKIIPEKHEKIMCELCGQFFPNISALKFHSQKHTDPTHECKICKKMFKHNRILQLHIKQRHLKLYNYSQCHVCGKKLAYKGSLRSHLLSHNSKKLFACHLCNKKFNLPAKLKMHLSRHTSEKLECEYCGRYIKYEWTLRKHIQIYHKNEGEFICEFCDRPYWKRNDLVKHKIRVHGWAPEHTSTNL